MAINKLKIDKTKSDINLKFYIILKYLVKSKLTDRQALAILDICYSINRIGLEDVIVSLTDLIQSFRGEDKKDYLSSITGVIQDEVDLDLLAFGIQLFLIKWLLLEEAKLTDVIIATDLAKLPPLSLEYDKMSVYRPYATRVNWALLSLLFFDTLEQGNINFISYQSVEFVEGLSKLAIKLKKQGVEPNQIFMLMFSESINQSIISDSWTDYEDRILTVLIGMWIPRETIRKIHDDEDKSTEYDFFFTIGGRTFWIGAKRTLRERYKQFIKTARTTKIDVMIEVTLWLDLNEEKAKTILSHWVYIFVADEVYQSRAFLSQLDWVYSVKELNLNMLKSLK